MTVPGLRSALLAGALFALPMASAVEALAQDAPAPSPGASQTTVAPVPAGETAAPEGGALATVPPVVGAPAAAPQADGNVVGAPPPPEVTGTEFQDWRVECYEPPVNGMRCQVVQQLVERNLDQVVLVTSLAFLPASGQTQIQMVLPLNFLLKRGVTFDVAGYTTTVGVDRCTEQGCFIEGIAAPELLAAMRRGREAEVAIVSDSGQTISIPFSLMGFTDAYRRMEEENRKPIPAADATQASEPDEDETAN